MAPILGIYASQISGHLTPPNSYASIATQTVGSGGASSITFSSIPSTYTHLQIRILSKTTSGDFNDLTLTANADSGANYSWHRIYGNGATVSTNAVTSTTPMTVGLDTGSTQASGVFATNVIDVLDYTSVNKNKTFRTMAGADANGSGYIILFSGTWYNSSTAVTSITLTPAGGAFTQYSSFALYGIR